MTALSLCLIAIVNTLYLNGRSEMEAIGIASLENGKNFETSEFSLFIKPFFRIGVRHAKAVSKTIIMASAFWPKFSLSTLSLERRIFSGQK